MCVGWQRYCKTCRSLRELDNPGTVFFSLAVAHGGFRVHLCEVKNLYSAQGNWLYHVGFMVRHPRDSYTVLPFAVSGCGYTGNQINSLKLSSVCKSASQAVHSRMQLTLHATRRTPHGASRLVRAMSAWLVKHRHAPSRHCRDARDHDYTTNAMHEIEYISPIGYPPPPAKINETLKASLHIVSCEDVTR